MDASTAIVTQEMNVAMTRGGNLILQSARGNIHNVSGALSASGSNKVTTGGGFFKAVIKFTAKHAQWVEYGRAGFGPKSAKVLHFFIGGAEIFTMKVGPAKAQRFLGKAFDSGQKYFLNECQVAVGRIIAKVMA
jgi:hypothetical protein